jgi:hypothetical protein
VGRASNGKESEGLIFVGPGDGHGDSAGMVVAVDTTKGVLNGIADHGISIGVYAEGHEGNGTAGSGAYLTFTSAANCIGKHP